ncbi:lipoate--protein ligase [Ruminococcaceae bacterium OttesenSCG-928-A16]|nr:lipoate--protein ligase [Ruminococcaceae bacterium OttesenSCG-928-A16]
MTLTVYQTTETNPWRNLAAEELLLTMVQPGQVILYLWQNDNTVVVGRNQNAWRECNVDLLEQDGGRLARRLSGGGAVYHDMGNQNFTFIARKAKYDLAKQTEVIRLAARQFGIEAVRSGRNDILAEGRKFSGNAFYRAGDFYYHHGTILMNSDMQKLGKYLNPSPEKLAGKGVTSVQARVVNLCQLAPQITPQAMQSALVKAFGSVYGAPVQTLASTALPAQKWNKLTEKHASAQWRMGKPFAYTARVGGRLSVGEVEILLQAREGKIEEAKVFTDAMDTDWTEIVAAALQGIKLDEKVIEASLACLSKQMDGDFLQELARLTKRLFV